jgi:hypothetical protein
MTLPTTGILHFKDSNNHQDSTLHSLDCKTFSATIVNSLKGQFHEIFTFFCY